jgi:hypothetical protein
VPASSPGEDFTIFRIDRRSLAVKFTFAKRAAQLMSASVTVLVCAMPFLTAPAVAAARSGIAVSITPLFSKLETSATRSFTATVLNDSKNEGVTWSIDGVDCNDVLCGTLSAPSGASGVPITYAAPSALPPSAIMVTATSVADNTKSAAAIIIVTSSALSVAISPSASSVAIAQKISVTASVSNNEGNRGVIWRLTGRGCGGLSCGKLSSFFSKPNIPITYTAPANLPEPADVTLTAISLADFTKSSSTTIALTPAVGAIVATAPTTDATLNTGTSQTFGALIQNDDQDKGVTWTLLGAPCSENACGTLSSESSASGTAIIYTAPLAKPEPSTITLRATSVADTTKSVAITINITDSAF